MYVWHENSQLTLCNAVKDAEIEIIYFYHFLKLTIFSMNDFPTEPFVVQHCLDEATINNVLCQLNNTIMLYLEIMDYLTANLLEEEKKSFLICKLFDIFCNTL